MHHRTHQPPPPLLLLLLLLVQLQVAAAAYGLQRCVHLPTQQQVGLAGQLAAAWLAAWLAPALLAAAAAAAALAAALSPAARLLPVPPLQPQLLEGPLQGCTGTAAADIMQANSN
jgi:hypothetical protein